MPTSLLVTKFYIPEPSADLVPRPQLIENLNIGSSRKLTLISAPAGFGKSTLVSAWVKQINKLVVWFSIDEDDNHIARFLACLVSTIQSAEIDLGIDPETILQSPQLPATESILTTIINAIAKTQGGLILVLDDFHLIEASAIHQAIEFLLDHMPPQMHIVIATRSDPNIHLASMRGRRQVNELRVTDLRFTTKEARVFVQQTAGKKIAIEQINTLNTRTEGWITGLRLAAVSMRDADDITGFISTFAGDHRYIADYLVDEVLARCSESTRDFLLQTSILERISAPLSDVLLGASGSQVVLEQLEQDNLFIMPLDKRREWYHYHHLFAELLRHRLKQIYPERIDSLHARASYWLEDNGFINQAIKHSLEMRDKQIASGLLEQYVKTILYQGSSENKNLVGWFNQLPKTIMRERPLLHIYHAWALMFESSSENINTIEQILSNLQKSLGEVDLDTALEKMIAGHILSIQGVLSQPPVQKDHNPHAVLEMLNKAQTLLPSSEIEIRSDNYINIGYEYLHLEDAEAALKANRDALTEAQVGDNHLIAIISFRNQALIAYYQGNLDQAIEICNKGITSYDHLHNKYGRPSPTLGILHTLLGFLLVERGELDKAEIELTQGFELLQWFAEYEAVTLGLIALARLYLLKGEGRSVTQFHKSFERYWSSHTALVETLQTQTELFRLEGNSSLKKDIENWTQTYQYELDAHSVFQGISPWAETQHLAHLTWIQSKTALFSLESDASKLPVLKRCMEYLDQRLLVSQQRDLKFRTIEYSILKALVQAGLGDSDQAIETLSYALSIAEHENIQRVFLDKGKPLVMLLQEVVVRDDNSNFAQKLLVRHDALKKIRLNSETQNLVEPLSDREMEVLQLVALGFTNREICERLFLALDTVKGHNRRIFGKLGVKNRAQAINKARSLNIISSQ